MSKKDMQYDLRKEMMIALNEEYTKTPIIEGIDMAPQLINPVINNLLAKGIHFKPIEFAKYWPYVLKAYDNPGYTWKQHKKGFWTSFLVGFPLFTLVAMAPAFLVGLVLSWFEISVAFWIKLVAAAGLALIPFALGWINRRRAEWILAQRVKDALPEKK